jgi:ABC-type branched-subunit amino acid transport system ATPase component
MITAHSLTKRYGSTTAVDNLTFEVQPGAATGFLGPNGSGKSTNDAHDHGHRHSRLGAVLFFRRDA